MEKYVIEISMQLSPMNNEIAWKFLDVDRNLFYLQYLWGIRIITICSINDPNPKENFEIMH